MPLELQCNACQDNYFYKKGMIENGTRCRRPNCLGLLEMIGDLEEMEPSKYKRQIIVTVYKEGFHQWKDAPEEVSFLRHPHRHMFKIQACFSVSHNDRDLEFFIQQRKLLEVLFEINWQDCGSCEMIAEFILEAMPKADWAEVWEDSENGARLTRE